MKTALVVQDSLQFLGGGELVCINTCFALQRLGYRVKLVSDVFRPDEVEVAFGMGKVLRACEQVKIPELGRKLARFSSLPGLYFASREKRFLEHQNADVMFVTRDPRRPAVLPNAPLFRFVYETALFRPFWQNYKYLKFVYQALYGRDSVHTTFLALSPRLVDELRANAYPNTELIYPSYGVGFRPKPKKNQVVYVTFLAPQKRIEDFWKIASHLPQVKFYLVARDTERINRIYGGYARRILASKPANVEYVEARIRQVPELLEESMVYLHTSMELGMGIAVMEALSAGCLPVTPWMGGAAEVLQAAGVGFSYDSIEEAVKRVKSETEGSARTLSTNGQRLTPHEIAERARIFSPEVFRTRLGELIIGHGGQE